MYFNFDDEEKFVVAPRRKKRTSTFTLRLTSMIDMFTILLVFLLKSYSVEGEIISVSKDLQLPESTAQKTPEATPILVVTNEWVILDGNPIERIPTISRSKQIVIRKLLDQLERQRIFSENLGRLDANIGFKGKITIQGDKEIPFEVLKKVMFTCGKVGYNNMLLAVNQEDQN
ncbi:MAG: ExbD/TolR family protein [bacterium]